MFNYHAIEQVTQDLVDCLLAEEFLGIWRYLQRHHLRLLIMI